MNNMWFFPSRVIRMKLKSADWIWVTYSQLLNAKLIGRIILSLYIRYLVPIALEDRVTVVHCGCVKKAMIPQFYHKQSPAPEKQGPAEFDQACISHAGRIIAFGKLEWRLICMTTGRTGFHPEQQTLEPKHERSYQNRAGDTTSSWLWNFENASHAHGTWPSARTLRQSRMTYTWCNNW